MDYTWQDLCEFALSKGLCVNEGIIGFGGVLCYQDGSVDVLKTGYQDEKNILTCRMTITQNRTPAQMKSIIEGLI